MDGAEGQYSQEQLVIVNVEDCIDVSSSASHSDRGDDLQENATEHEDGLPTDRPSLAAQVNLDETNRLVLTNSVSMRRSPGYRHQHQRSPLNSVLWISVEFVVTVGQIVASLVVLLLSRNENPGAPLFAWVVGYASGCVATLPILYCRYSSRNQGIEQDISQSGQSHWHDNSPESRSYSAVSVTITQQTDEESQNNNETIPRDARIPISLESWLSGLLDHFKMALDCFFAVWFVVGNVWIFGGHSSSSDAPKLYRLCIVLLTFSCIGYAMPFILCTTVCCCLPCIMSVFGIQEELSQARGASSECINALPIYKFKLKDTLVRQTLEISSGVSEEGVFAPGTERERLMCGEDAICCICLAKYADDEELKELPCCHIFHVECINKWLKINASCPLCKCGICEGRRLSSARGSQSRQL
ncbi:hypothetical protein MLD38_004897 [Melastoma candidum]|uniref:Uncharacterized protein n=1 Tax=Melastoma candidum TaxID=119954 RepID=A0ACB9SC22_9MYRT|nr:hypothetical protein MLD38_004897 [Melastoma candidum]